MSKESLWALSPLDGRYEEKTKDLVPFYSEGALISYRIYVEVKWLEELHKALKIPLAPQVKSQLEKLQGTQDPSIIEAVKKIERKTNHDVKAVEYFLQEKLKEQGATSQTLALIHFGCTSEDINNLAYSLMIKNSIEKVILPWAKKIVRELTHKTREYAQIPMLSRTHGQTASPSTLGKEVGVFGYRLKKQISKLKHIAIEGKFNGAVGNFNAHTFAFPDLDWPMISSSFIKKLGLEVNPYTTQIEPHDYIAEICQAIARINTISIDLCRDLWGYISLGYFKQKTNPQEVGSSTMPHKVNPIDFENAEGNYGLSTSLAHYLAEKLPISRFQRDLSDSTSLRSLANVWGHHLLAQKATLKGLTKLTPNPIAIQEDLHHKWEVLAEPIQTVMRKFGVTDAYEQIKEKTRGVPLDKKALEELIDQCHSLPPQLKEEVKKLTPSLYTGLAAQLAQGITQELHEL